MARSLSLFLLPALALAAISALLRAQMPGSLLTVGAHLSVEEDTHTHIYPPKLKAKEGKC